MQLEIEKIQELAPIKFNYEDVKKWVTEKAKEYKSVVYTEETLTTAKTDRATLNKVAKAINDEKIRIKKEVLKPFEDFENKCKELMAIIDDASNSIDVQIKAFEEKEKNEKKEQIKLIFDSYVGSFKEVIDFDTIFNLKWLNKTYTLNKIEEEINLLVEKINNDFKIIDSQIKDNTINQIVKVDYFENINDVNVLNIALQKGIKLEETLQQSLKKVENKLIEEEGKLVIEQLQQELQVVDFRVWVTEEQKMKIREFLIENNIKYGMVE